MYNSSRKVVLIAAASFSWALGAVNEASAQEVVWHPEQPVSLIAHTKPGGSPDVLLRTLASALSPLIDQDVMVVNAPGGGGATQMSRIKNAAPDGTTLGVNTSTHLTGMLTSLAGTFSLDDFSWIAQMQVDPVIYVVRAESELDDLDDLVTYAKAREGELNIGGYGPMGSQQSITVKMFEEAADIEVNWVAHQSTPEVITALLGGHIDVGTSNLGALRQFFESERIKGLGVFGPDRLANLPDVATFDEQGIDVDETWLQVRGIYGPAGMDPELREDIAEAIFAAMQSESYQEYARVAGVVDGDLGPEGYTAFIEKQSDTAKEQLGKVGLLD